MEAIVGILALSFSSRDEEPNPCNWQLARETLRIYHELTYDGHDVVLAAQWEVARAIRRLEQRPPEVHEITLSKDGRYLGTREVVEQAKPFLRQQGVSKLVIVANPFIHLSYARWLARRHAFKSMRRHVGWIGFDKESNQVWCRSWWRFSVQSTQLLFGKQHGYAGRQEP